MEANALVGAAADCLGSINSQGFNLVQNTQGCVQDGASPGNITGLAPRLGVLQNNGGPTQTHGLGTGVGIPEASCAAASPAIGTASPDVDPGIPGDRRPRGLRGLRPARRGPAGRRRPKSLGLYCTQLARASAAANSSNHLSSPRAAMKDWPIANRCLLLAALGGVPVTINDPDCVAKTFPKYVTVLKSIAKP